MGAKVSVCALVVAAATTSSSGSSSDIGSGSSSGSSSTTAGLFYHESFDDDVLVTGAFTKSMDAKYKGQPLLVKPAVSAIKGLELDKGLSLSQENRHYGASAKFPTVLDVKGKDLVVQYDLKLEDGLQCGGAYIKLLRATPDLDLTKLNGDTPYTIMFGPDKCAANNKVHFIVQYQSPVTQKWEEKHFNTTLNIKTDKANTHLYTLVMKQNNDFEIYIDKRLGKKGNLLTHMVPPINPPSTVDDPTDSKPDDWVDNDLIDDPDAKKPDDWDEDAPKMIENPKAQVRCRVVSASHAWTCSYFLCHTPRPHQHHHQHHTHHHHHHHHRRHRHRHHHRHHRHHVQKPKGWSDDAPEQIPDPKAEKPAGWDDEEDGEWEAPLVDNPACEVCVCDLRVLCACPRLSLESHERKIAVDPVCTE